MFEEISLNKMHSGSQLPPRRKRVIDKTNELYTPHTSHWRTTKGVCSPFVIPGIIKTQLYISFPDFPECIMDWQQYMYLLDELFSNLGKTSKLAWIEFKPIICNFTVKSRWDLQLELSICNILLFNWGKSSLGTDFHSNRVISTQKIQRCQLHVKKVPPLFLMHWLQVVNYLQTR